MTPYLVKLPGQPVCPGSGGAKVTAVKNGASFQRVRDKLETSLATLHINTYNPPGLQPWQGVPTHWPYRAWGHLS